MSIIANKVYELLKQIPKGKVTTYKLIAEKLQMKGYRAIGQIVGATQTYHKCRVTELLDRMERLVDML